MDTFRKYLLTRQYVFGEIPENESWSFCDTQEISLTSLAFLCMRSLLSQELYSKKSKLPKWVKLAKQNLGNQDIQITLMNFRIRKSRIRNYKQKEIPSFIQTYLQKNTFSFWFRRQKTKIVTGGGIFQEKNQRKWDDWKTNSRI